MTNKDKHKLLGIVATVAFHAIALVLLFTLCFRTPLPLPGEAGVEVNLGMYAQAMSQQDEEATNQETEETTSQQDNESESKQVVEEILSEDEDIPSLEEVAEELDEAIEPEEMEEETIEEQEVVEEIVEEKPVVNQRAMFQAPKNKQETPSEGNASEQSGIQGNSNGLKEIERYEGFGESDNGTSYYLEGREAKNIAKPNEDFEEEITIVVDIWVDREGRVVDAKIGKGTFSTIPRMRDLALNAAKNSIFSKDDNASEIQKGSITYKFKKVK